VNTVLVHRQMSSAADVGVRNSQPEGIGRVVVLGELACWNNLGRNVVFADRRLRPHAVFGATLFPGEDEPSQFDLDVHSILDMPELGLILVLNHFGTVRGFKRCEILRQLDGRPVEPTAQWSYIADVERTVAVEGRLVSSAPRSDGARGLLVSESLDSLPACGPIPNRLCATAFGEVTAVGVVPRTDGPLVAMGGDARVVLAPLEADRVRNPLWEAEVGFRVASIDWHEGALWTAGPDHTAPVDDYDWEQLRGGGFAVLSPADGRILQRGQLPPDVAWGTGGVAVAPFDGLMAAASRTGRLYLVDPHRQNGLWSTPSLADTSLGIAHLAIAGRQVLCGFNRGGYRLHSFAQSPAGAEDP
jgi:hypothetical protein